MLMGAIFVPIICSFLVVAQAMDVFQYSYITTEELEQALEDHNMGDEETIKDIISEVDTDHVSRYCYKMIDVKFMPKEKGHFLVCLLILLQNICRKRDDRELIRNFCNCFL